MPAYPSAAPVAMDKLTYRTLGKTGLKVTSVGFGCMITSDASVIARAADAGINYFDTARVYQSGNNERMVGAALKGKRQQVYISTKTGAQDKAEALAHLDTSLKELGTDHVDIWYLHGKQTAAQLTDELLEAQQIAKRDGKIRFAGVSFHGGHAEMIPAMLQLNHFDVFLISYNFTMDPAIEPLIESARKANVGLVAMKALAGGVKPTVRSYQVDPEKLNRLKAAGAPVAALKWVMKNPNIDTVIPSIVDEDQLAENIAAMGAPFNTADGKLLTARLEEIRPLYCRMCGHCEGQCSHGLPVPDMLRFLMYAEGYGQFALGRDEFRALPQHVAAVRCSDCSSCSVHCPNGVEVASRLHQAQQLFG